MAKTIMDVIKESKEICECNIISILWNNQDLFYVSELKLKYFSFNMWNVYYAIIEGIIKEKKSIDSITVDFYLEKHPKLKEKYQEYGGFEAIKKTSKYANDKNLEGYIEELHKWNTVIKLAKNGFPVKDKLKDFIDMSLDDIYNEYEVLLNDTFVNASGEVKSTALSAGLEDVIEKADAGEGMGLPYTDLPMLTNETGGQHDGDITLWGALSNVGKSTIIRSAVIPSSLKHGEPLIVMLNEDDSSKWKSEMLIWTANNIYDFDIQKHHFRNGHFTKEMKSNLYICAKWLKDQETSETIRLIPFKRYSTKLACKLILKYCSMGIKNFILDTFKADAGTTDAVWLQGQQAMVDIADIVKKSNKNVHINITFQLGKQSAKQRFYTQDNVGMFKNIIDPCANCVMARNFMDDEYAGEKKELKVYKYAGKNKSSKIPVIINKSFDCNYQIFFIVKNRHGAANKFQIVVKHDLSRNIIQEVGFCNVPVDF